PEFFTYGEACRAPDNIAVETQNESSIRVEWTPRPGFNRYVVRYRERDTPGANWYEDETLLTTHNLENLIDATAYEIQVQTLCNGDYQGPFS
ncbi:MAG TPA: fibronectin type III domain-containing protein, partial [Saprospiraceae bacterium]|nr:fibronectin type III domain-containing protein [Saprospiraceae bacterium]